MYLPQPSSGWGRTSNGSCHARYRDRPLRAVVLVCLATAVFGGAAASNVAIDQGIHGPAIGNANSCASGATARPC